MKLIEHFKELSLHPKNAEELKGLILQLAVNGKLTANWRKENPGIKGASDLFDRVKTHNLELLRSKKRRVKEIAFEDNILLDLPKTWVQVKNKDLFTLQKGKNPKDLSESVMKYPYQDIEALDRGNIRRYSNDEKAPKCSDEDILVVCDGSRSGLVLNGKAGVVGSTLAVIETPKFIQDYVKILFLQDYKRANANMKGAAIPHLDTSVLLATDVGFPPIEEQKVIVKQVNALFKEIEQLETLNKERIKHKEDFVESALNKITSSEDTSQEWNYLAPHFKKFFTEKKSVKSLRETILQLAVQGKLTKKWRKEYPNVEPASELIKKIDFHKEALIRSGEIRKGKKLPDFDVDFLFDLPDNWEMTHLGRLSKQITDGTHHTPKYTNSGIKFLSVKDISSGKINLENTRHISPQDHHELIKRCKPEVNDILFCRIGTLGVPVIVNIIEPFSIFVSVGLIKFFTNEVLPEYLRLALDSPFLWKQYMKVKAGGSHTNKLNLRDVPNLMIPLPPLEEQKGIIEKVNSLMALCDELEEQIINSETQIKLLMKSCLKEVLEA